jgi:RNA polymerase primary sigma factor
MRDPRDKVVLTSLEEDFKNIGIIKESKEVEVDDNEDADLEEGRRRASGGRKSIRTKRMKSGDKAKARASYRKRKSKIKKQRKKRGRTSRGKKLKKLAKAMAKKTESTSLTATDRINSILEDVRDIVSSVNEDDSSKQDLDNAIKSFANVAIISEMLATFFSESIELVESEGELSDELTDAADYFQEQAEQAAFLATALDEGAELDEDIDVDELFQEFMGALVEGLDLYADLTEDEDEDFEDDDLEEDEDDSDLEEDEDDLEEMEDDCKKCKGDCKCDMKESVSDRLRALMAGND